MSTKNPQNDGVESPFIEDSSLLIDMTKRTGLDSVKGKTVRVELRRVKGQVSDDPNPAIRPVEDSFVVGVISENALPKEGELFIMSYHALSVNAGFGAGMISDFGSINTGVGVTKVSVVDDCHFFETAEGVWRLKILNSDS